LPSSLSGSISMVRDAAAMSFISSGANCSI
jgi:hypothetical protein